MKIISLFAIVFLIASVHANIPQDVQDGFVHDQLQNIIVRPQSMNSDAIITLYDPTQQFIKPHAAISALHASFSVYDVANVVAETLGVAPLHTSARTPASALPFSLSSSSLFYRPRANVLLAVESVGSATLSQLPTLSALRSSSPHMNLNQVCYPATANNLAVSLSTARAPASVNSQAPTLAQAIHRAFHDKALFVSASSNPAVAQAYTRGVVSSNVVTSTLQHGQLFGLTVENIVSQMQNTESQSIWKVLKQQNIQMSASTNSVVVATSAVVATFDLTDMSDLNVFAELQFMYNLPSTVSAAAVDDYPDVYALTISGLTSIANKYGAASAQFQAATAMVDAAVQAIINQFNAVYPQRVVFEVALLGSVHAIPTQVSEAVNTVFTQNHMPAVHLVNDAIAGPTDRNILTRICQQLTQQLASMQYSAYCPTLSSATTLSNSMRFSTLATTAAASNGTTVVTSNDIGRYQIALWTTVILIVTVIATVYSIMYMDLKRDTLLYSKFNPNWGGRKN